MLKKEVEQLIAIEFARWATNEGLTKPNGKDARRFFSHLQAEQQHLLSFRTAEDDKWQTVHAFLLRRDSLWIEMYQLEGPSRC